jgi:hypothetical protein
MERRSIVLSMIEIAYEVDFAGERESAERSDQPEAAITRTGC